MRRGRAFRIILLFLAAVLAICCAAAEGELRPYSDENGYTYVTFGRYPQSIEGVSPDEGTVTWTWYAQYKKWAKETRKELKLKAKDPLEPFDPGPIDPTPILWRVLSSDDEKIYLMSEYILFAMPVHPDMSEYRENGKQFENTSLSKYLNGEFAESAFTPEELENLVPYGTIGKVFLPSNDDLCDPAKGFSKKKTNTRKAKATEYAVRVTGAIVYRIATGNHTPYWLREQSTTDLRHSKVTKQTGKVGHLHCDATDVGVRPTVFLAAEGFRITGGSGTKDDPYRLACGEE